MENLNGKKVLLIGLREYSLGIINELEKLGAEVSYIADKPSDSVISKILGRLQIKLYIKVLDIYYSYQISNLESNDFDYILVLRGEYTSLKALKKLKSTFPSSKLILYMWDSIKNNKFIMEKWDSYDKIYTFDRKDYLNYSEKIDFLPLFYYNSYLPEVAKEIKYDIAFIGTGHGDRVSIIKKLKRDSIVNDVRVYSYIYLPHVLIYYKNKIFNKSYKDVTITDVSFDLLPIAKVYEIYDQSNCIIDIESSSQTGLTMRTIEMIGLKKKMITTNKDIVNYDFFNPNNILVVDRANVIIDKRFLSSKYEELSEELYFKYSLRGWLLQLLK